MINTLFFSCLIYKIFKIISSRCGIIGKTLVKIYELYEKRLCFDYLIIVKGIWFEDVMEKANEDFLKLLKQNNKNSVGQIIFKKNE